MRITRKNIASMAKESLEKRNDDIIEIVKNEVFCELPVCAEIKSENESFNSGRVDDQKCSEEKINEENIENEQTKNMNIVKPLIKNSMPRTDNLTETLIKSMDSSDISPHSCLKKSCKILTQEKRLQEALKTETTYKRMMSTIIGTESSRKRSLCPKENFNTGHHIRFLSSTRLPPDPEINEGFNGKLSRNLFMFTNEHDMLTCIDQPPQISDKIHFPSNKYRDPLIGCVFDNYRSFQKNRSKNTFIHKK